MNTLYLVGTPIGNLEDITLRALRILREVPLIAAEDTRVTGRLLKRFEIDTPLTSYHEHNKLEKLGFLLDHLKTQDLALVSDAGMPGLSDPGFELVQAAIQQQIAVVPIPGPSAVISALVVSGLPSDGYVYLGFLPRRSAARRERLQSVQQIKQSLIAFESPHRLQHALADIHAIMGDRPIAVARELTKLHEEVHRGTPQELLEHFAQHPAKGEITLVIGGAPAPTKQEWTDQMIDQALTERLSQGESPTQIAKSLSKLSGRPRRELYKLATKKGRPSGRP